MSCLWDDTSDNGMPITMATSSWRHHTSLIHLVDVPAFFEAADEAMLPAHLAVTISDPGYRHMIKKIHEELPRGQDLVHALVHAQHRDTGTVLHDCARTGDEAGVVPCWGQLVGSQSHTGVHFLSRSFLPPRKL